MCAHFLLVLQAELATGNHRIAYQHKSFREFLVARYWASVLWKLADPGADRKDLESRLLGARLFAPEDESFDFLVQIPHASPWEDPQREALYRWADARFHDESSNHEPKVKPSWSVDQTPALREAALAIAGSLKIGGHAPRGVQVRHADALRTLVAWAWLEGLEPGLQASAVRAEGVYLLRAELEDSNLALANLRGADLTGAYLNGAELGGAELGGANLSRANLNGANLNGTNLNGANLIEANLGGADLIEADLNGANLIEADLRRANLNGADFSQADLRGADLTGADFSQADLRGANLEGATLSGARYSHHTQWPPDFDPAAAGAIKIDDKQPATDEAEDDSDDEPADE